MAQRRLKAVLEPPSSLVVFDPAEWTAHGDNASWQAFKRWKDARHKWVKDHGSETSLGDMIDVFRAEHDLLMERIRRGDVA